MHAVMQCPVMAVDKGAEFDSFIASRTLTAEDTEDILEYKEQLIDLGSMQQAIFSEP